MLARILTKRLTVLLTQAAVLAACMALVMCHTDKPKTASGNAPYYVNNDSLLTPAQLLGKKLFFDKNLSNPPGQACAGCHAPDVAFTDPGHLAVSRGAIPDLTGTRNSPSVAYAAYSPFFHYDSAEEVFVGGLFWDGRAATLSEQAINPLLNHLEMNCTDKEMVRKKLLASDYKDLFLSVMGPTSLSNAETTCNAVVEAIEEYEETKEVSPFTSKFDYYLKGKVSLTEQELRGLKAFNDTARANCAACHPSTPDPLTGAVLFTDFTYDNIGIPANPEVLKLNPNYTTDLGLGAVLKNPGENGKFKVPSLRNVAITAPYFHNGAIKTLEETVRFYSERDSGKFGPPEVKENLNTEELGNLKLTKREVDDIAAFMRTLTDGYRLPQGN